MLSASALRAGRRCAFNALRIGSTRTAAFRIPATYAISHQRRCMSTPPPQVAQSDLSMDRYHVLSESTMETLFDSLEAFVDTSGNPSFEVEYHSGVLTFILGSHGTYVINKQPPNKQIWLSSPQSGPVRYDYSESKDDWVYSRDGRSLETLLETEIEQMTGQPVQLGLKPISALVA